MVFRRGFTPYLIGVFCLIAVMSHSGERDSQKRGPEAEGGGNVSISGRVVDAVTGAPVPGVLVSTLEMSTVTDSGGRYKFDGLECERDAILNFRVTDEKGSVIGCAFIPLPVKLHPISAVLGERVDLKVADSSSDLEDFELRISEVKRSDTDGFCGQCHKPNPCLAETPEGGSWEEVTHLGGLVVVQKDFEALKAKLLSEGIKPDMYPYLRYQDAHPPKADVATSSSGAQDGAGHFKMPDQLELSDDGTANCETCHTRHTPTENSMFLKMEISGQALLCRQCHL